jgi:hypothetical protein
MEAQNFSIGFIVFQFLDRLENRLDANA